MRNYLWSNKCKGYCFGSGLKNWFVNRDPGRPKLSPKREKIRNFMLEEGSLVGWRLLLERGYPFLKGFKKTCMTFFDQN
jgi:hypothetical protein